jgi:glyoxylase-like metal-dependent hydrolase (beta-lactamase superfamily II)/rhodanese-related sulfurtransferase
MKIEQIYTGCLAHGAYYIESDGEAAVIDPLREVQPYLTRAEKNGANIRYVFETHFHADFVSGHLDLARKTGADIVYGPTAQPAYNAHIAQDGEVFKVGKASIEVLHTPGHTLESACFVLRDEKGKASALFSGDTLFIGDVGRPDLAQKAAKMTQDELAGLLYDSIRNKIMPLPDDIVVYPGHGAGSACGKNMSSSTTDTLGHQKASNYALRAGLDKDTFIKEVTTGLTKPPGYFPLNAMLNKQGYESMDTILARGRRALSPAAFEAAANETGALILDTRDAGSFAAGFIPNSINIGIDGSFAPWIGALIPDIKQPVLIVADQGREEEVITRMARVGYDGTLGYLKGGFAAWKNDGREIDHVPEISVEELAALKNKQPVNILDVRRQSEFDSEHVIDAENVPLDYINDNMAEVDKEKTYYVHCAGGYRSMIFNSILRARGYEHLVDIKGGFKAMKESGLFNISDYICPTTLL